MTCLAMSLLATLMGEIATQPKLVQQLIYALKDAFLALEGIVNAILCVMCESVTSTMVTVLSLLFKSVLLNANWIW